MRSQSVFVLAAAAACAGPAAAAEVPAGPTVSEVVVSAAPYAVSLDSATTSVDVVTRAELDTAPPVGIGDLLAGMPGLRSTFYGPGASRPVIRGLSGPRGMILQNGVGMVDASALSPDHAVASEPSEASRIEVLRGPSTLAYGGSAIGGVVNILDDRIPSKVPAHGFAGRLTGSAGSADDSYALSAGVTAGKGPFVVALDGVKRASGDYSVPTNPVSARYAADRGVNALDDRVVRNTDVHLEAYGGGLSYVGDDGFLGASVKRTTTRYGLPYAQVDGPPPEEGPVYIDLKQTRWDLRGERAIDLGPFDRIRLSAGYADYQHAEIAVADGAVGTRFLSKGGEGRLELVQRDRDGWQGAVGFQGLKRDFQALGDEAFVPPVKVDELGVFVLQRLDRDAWGLEGGARLDRRRLDADLGGRPTSPAAASLGVDWSRADANQAFTSVSASAAAFWRPAPAWFLSLSVAANRRAPTEFELFSDGPHAGTNAYQVGDPTLKPERVTSLEATIRRTGDRGQVEAHAYVARYRGFISETATGVFVDDAGVAGPDGELPVFRFAASDPTFVGGEVHGSYTAWRDGDRRLVVEGSGDYVRATSDAGPPARIPPWSLTGRATFEAPRLEAMVEVRRVGAQDRVAAFETPSDGYTMVNAQLSGRPFSDRRLKLFVEGRNLGDVAAREHASFLKDIAPLPGRTFRAGAAVEF